MERIRLSLEKLEAWIDKNGYAGYDPYDIKSNRMMTKLISLGNRFFLFEVIREIVIEFTLLFPVTARKLLRIKPQINAKALGLLASSYMDLYAMDKNPSRLQKLETIFKLLEDQAVHSKEGIGWGYPFNWQSSQYIPAFTPNGIVTTAVADAYWKNYQRTGSKKDLDYCVLICEFLDSLPKDSISKTMHCYSYTPLYQNHVHNLNLFVAEFLLKVGKECNRQTFIDNARKAIQYTIEDQKEDGRFDYNGPPEKPQEFYDNYHTSFVIRMLYSIYLLDRDPRVKTAMDKCYHHWVENFFTEEFIPKFTPERLYRIDIHSSAESINCLSILEDEYPGSLEKAEKIALWTIEELQDKDGSFYHGIMKARIWGGSFKSKIAYLRWGQAWMMRAFSQFLLARENKKINTYQT